MDRDLRDWLRGMAERRGHDTPDHPEALSKEGAEYLARIATDGTLKGALAELAASDVRVALAERSLGRLGPDGKAS